MYWRSGPTSQSHAISQASSRRGAPGRGSRQAAMSRPSRAGRASLQLIGERRPGDRAVGIARQIIERGIHGRQIERQLRVQPCGRVFDRLLDRTQAELAERRERTVGRPHDGGHAATGARSPVQASSSPPGRKPCAKLLRRYGDAGAGLAGRPGRRESEAANMPQLRAAAATDRKRAAPRVALRPRRSASPSAGPGSR